MMKTIDHFFSDFGNAQIVCDFFGYWPSLHDSEVLKIVLDRELGFDFSGPKVFIDLYWCADWLTDDPAKRMSCKIAFVFDRVEFGSITGFNHQNATVEFEIEKYHCDRLCEERYRIKFGSIGAILGFTCNAIGIFSISPFQPPDYFDERESNNRHPITGSRIQLPKKD
jgi:hypothetical protein